MPRRQRPARFDDAVAAFHKRWSGSPIIMDKWFAAQAAAPRGGFARRVAALRAHPDFDIKNPNRIRSLAASFATRNPRAFMRRMDRAMRFLPSWPAKLIAEPGAGGAPARPV